MPQNWQLGLAVKLADGPAEIMQKVSSFGFTVCQVGVTDVTYYTEETLAILKAERQQYGLDIAILGTGPPGRVVYDFIEGPETIGLVAESTRDERAAAMMQGSDFAAELGIRKVHGHLGFVPEDSQDPRYKSLLPVLRDIARHCRSNGQDFLWETGPETPTTLLRTLEDTGENNVFINFDPANLLMYGKANPVDALDILGPYLGGVHIKDGHYPTGTRELGKEAVVGEGQVDFPLLLRKLRDHDYRGPLIIECELSGERQFDAIRIARRRLEEWLLELNMS